MKVYLTCCGWHDPSAARRSDPSMLKGSFSQFNPKLATELQFTLSSS